MGPYLLYSLKVGLLPWKPVEVCKGASRSRVLLHTRCHLDQVRVSFPWVADGCAQQHTGDLKDDKLYFHLSWKVEAELV